jgi:ribose-phosphate pyrophosphokinase
MFVFGGSTNQELVSRVAGLIGGRVGNVEISKFSNDEVKLRVVDEKVGSKAIVLQSLVSPVETNLVEFCFLCDALQRLGVREITAVIPWLGYSKQDKVFRPGEPLSVKVVAKILQVVPIKHLLTFDLHNLAILGFFDIPVNNLSAKSLFADYFKKKVTPHSVVVAPDAGAIKSSTAYAGELNVPVVYMDKKRDLATGEVKVMGISRPIDGADVIIVDDMIVTGSTLIHTAQFLKTQKIRSLSVAATHHLYVPGAQAAIEESGFDDVVVTDTITPKVKSKKLTVLTIADIIAAELGRLDEQ